MSIDGIKLDFGPIQGVPGLDRGATKPQEVGSQKSFGQMFENAIREVNDLQKSADSQIEGLTLGKDGVTSHGAMLALEKADIAFQLMSTIRAKILRAYEEVIRTQV